MTYHSNPAEFSAFPMTREQQLKSLANSLWWDLVEITDTETILTVSNDQLVEQVSYVVSGLLPKYQGKVTEEELREMAQTLSIDLSYSSKAQPLRRTIH